MLLEAGFSYILVAVSFFFLVSPKTLTYYDDDSANTATSKKTCSMKGEMSSFPMGASTTPSASLDTPMIQQQGMPERTVTQTITEHECSLSGMSATTLLSICTTCYKDLLMISPNPSGGLLVVTYPQTSVSTQEQQMPISTTSSSYMLVSPTSTFMPNIYEPPDN